MSLRRVGLVSLNEVQVGTSLRRLKSVGFFTYQLDIAKTSETASSY